MVVICPKWPNLFDYNSGGNTMRHKYEDCNPMYQNAIHPVMFNNLYFLVIATIGMCLFFLNNNAIGKEKQVMKIKVESAAFKEGGTIPSKYTCDGIDISPPLSWSGIPDGTNSISLISDDPDAPMGTWVHWVLYNIPANVSDLHENLPTKNVLKNKAKQGTNDFGKIGYGGPCPPGGTHRYYFKLYALDKELDLEPGATKEQLLKAMDGHIMAEGQLMGKYSRQR